MNYKRYEFLMESFEQGYKVDLKNLILISKTGRTLSITLHKKRTPIVTIRSKQYSITEVIGAWMGMNVIDNYCFFKDGNVNNYHPGNLIWASKEDGNTWLNLKNPPTAKLNRSMVKFIREFELKGSGIKIKDLAEMYGVSHYTIKDIRSKTACKWRSMKVPESKIN